MPTLRVSPSWVDRRVLVHVAIYQGNPFWAVPKGRPKVRPHLAPTPPLHRRKKHEAVFACFKGDSSKKSPSARKGRGGGGVHLVKHRPMLTSIDHDKRKSWCHLRVSQDDGAPFGYLTQKSKTKHLRRPILIARNTQKGAHLNGRQQATTHVIVEPTITLPDVCVTFCPVLALFGPSFSR